ncbi:MAG TPA: anti-sigma factor antagonist [Campylobacterales bacterium]|nr:anti-sigma factor antagonist [Campylobacterales bacterium]
MSISTTDLKKSKKITLLVQKFDVSNMQEIKQKINKEIKSKNSDIVIDLSFVSFLDSSGLSVLIATFKQLNAKKKKLQLCGLQEQPLELLKITQLHKIFTVINDCNSVQ